MLDCIVLSVYKMCNSTLLESRTIFFTCKIVYLLKYLDQGCFALLLLSMQF